MARTGRAPQRVRVFILGIVTLVAIAPCLAHACRCVEPTRASAAYRTAALIVEGTVLEVAPRSEIEGFAVKLKVMRVWKSDVAEEISFTTGSNCRYEVQPNKKYLLFLVESQPNEFTTGRCMGNGLVAKKAGFLNWLKKKGRPGKVLPKS